MSFDRVCVSQCLCVSACLGSVYRWDVGSECNVGCNTWKTLLSYEYRISLSLSFSLQMVIAEEMFLAKEVPTTALQFCHIACIDAAVSPSSCLWGCIIYKPLLKKWGKTMHCVPANEGSSIKSQRTTLSQVRDCCCLVDTQKPSTILWRTL